MIEYRKLKSVEINRELFWGFIRRQVVTDCWRRIDGEWVIKSDPFVDDWSEEDFTFLVKCLRNTVTIGGVVYGAFDGSVLKGFASVEPQLFGGEQKYACFAGYARQGHRTRIVHDSLRLGAGARSEKVVHLGALGCGKSGVLQGNGVR